MAPNKGVAQPHCSAGSGPGILTTVERASVDFYFPHHLPLSQLCYLGVDCSHTPDLLGPYHFKKQTSD